MTARQVSKIAPGDIEDNAIAMLVPVVTAKGKGKFSARYFTRKATCHCSEMGTKESESSLGNYLSLGDP